MSYALYFLLCTFTLYFPCFAFLLLIKLEALLVKRFSFVFIKVRPSVSQTYVCSAENEERYTLSNTIRIKFQNCCFFSLRSSLIKVRLKCTQTNLKIHVMEFLFSTRLQAEDLQLDQNYAPLQIFYNVLLRFVAIYNEFFNILVTFISQSIY